MDNLSDSELETVISLVLRHADELADNAGFAGEMHDGGAFRLRKGVEMFRLGMAKVTPDEWSPFVKKMRTQQDPEFAEYMRLKEKFEDA